MSSNNNNKKLVVALDIDGTLLSNIFLNKNIEFDNKIRNILLNNLDLIDVFEETNDLYNYTFFRPKLNIFLQKLNEFAEIVLFSARNYEYALLAKKQIDPKNIYIKNVYNIYNTSPLNNSFPGPKDLQCLLVNNSHRKLEKIVIIDDWWDTNGLLHLTNFVPIIGWNIENIKYNLDYINILKNDNCLLNDILPFLQTLINVEDVRPVIAEYLNNDIFKQKLNNIIKNINNYIIYYNSLNYKQINKIHLNRKYSLIESFNNNKKEIDKYQEDKIETKKEDKIETKNNLIIENIDFIYKKEYLKYIEKNIFYLIPTYKDTLNLLKFNLQLIQKYNKYNFDNIYSNPNYFEVYF